MPPVDKVITPSALREWPLPQPGQGKSSRGRVLVVGGARVTPGAAILAGLGALRVGAGVLTLGVGSSVAASVAVAVPEAGVVWLSETEQGSIAAGSVSELAGRLAHADAILVGPGLDDAELAAALLVALIDACAPELPFVLDAFALGALPGIGTAAQALAGRLVLTPNSSEIRRLLELDASGEVTDAMREEVADRYGAVLSSDNHVWAPDGSHWTVPAGHPGLGTSGSGDVLAGAVLGLIGRGASLTQAACWATYLHAAAGDRLAASVGALGFLARELLDAVPAVLSELQA
jgi:hydroxyethylthiazole kinase-like uncharacterized protein yjeF